MKLNDKKFAPKLKNKKSRDFVSWPLSIVCQYKFPGGK